MCETTPAIDPTAEQGVKLLQDQIALHLTYKLRTVHKLKIKLADGTLALFHFNDRDPSVTFKQFSWLQSIGVELAHPELLAVEAHMKLGRILLDGYVCDEWKRILPLVVASIGGNPTAYTASTNARQPRPKADRRSALAKAVAKERERDPELSALDILYRLDGGDIVKEHKNGRVWYWENDELVSVGLDRFETIFSEQKPSTG